MQRLEKIRYINKGSDNHRYYESKKIKCENNINKEGEENQPCVNYLRRNKSR